MEVTTVWLAGAKSALGQALKPLLHSNRHLKLIETDKEVDITNEEETLLFADMHRPAVIINTAAISDPKACEEDMVEAFKVNALGARNLAEASHRHNAVMIQISSDDVFEGANGTSFIEFDQPGPKSVYAKSKLAGEEYVKELNPKHIIIRSSWVYGMDKPFDFYHKVVNAAKNGKPFEASVEEISTPTSAESLAQFVLNMVDHPSYGTFHASDEGKCSRYDFAKAILEANDLPADKLIAVQEPKTYTVLENLMSKMLDLEMMPQWQEDLNDYVKKGGSHE